MRKQDQTGGAAGPQPSDGPEYAPGGQRRWPDGCLPAWCRWAVILLTAWLAQPHTALASVAPFDGFYAEMVQALERRNTQAMFSRYAPDCVVTDTQGRRKPLKQVREEAERNLKLFRDLRFQVRLNEAVKQGTRVQVSHRTRLEGELVADDGRRQRVVVESDAEDSWEQQSGQWRIISSRVQSERNLSPAPTAPAGPARPSGSARKDGGPAGSTAVGFDTAATDLAVKYANGCYANQRRDFCDRLTRHVAHWMARCETQRSAFVCNTANRVVEIDVGMRAANSRPRF